MGDIDAVEKGDVPYTDHQESVDYSKPAAIEDTPVLEQNFNFWSACSLGLSSGNAWAVFGASIVMKCVLFLPSLT